MFNTTLIYLILLLQGFAGQGSFTLESESLFTFKGEFSNGEPMGTPKGVATFSDGSFALSEYYVPEIKIFSSDGTYLKTISRQGRGPGEFEEIESIFVNNKDQLLAIDHVQLKLVAFNPDGTSEEYYIFKNRPSVRSFHQTKEGSYIIGMKAFLRIGALKNDYIYQEISKEFEFSGEAFVTLNDIHEAIKEDIGKQVTIGMSGSTESSALTDNDDLVLAPKVYSGTMIVFQGESENGFKDKQYLPTGDYGTAIEEFKTSKKLDYNILSKA